MPPRICKKKKSLPVGENRAIVAGMEYFTEPDKAFKGYAKALGRIRKTAYPQVARGTINTISFQSRMHMSNVVMPRVFTLRNTFENKKSLKHTPVSNTLDINQMKAAMGQLAIVPFARGPAPTEDMAVQETGRLIKARPGQKRVRTATPAARTGGNFRKPVARVNRPSKGDNWPTMDDIERRVGLRNGGKNRRSIPLQARVHRAHAIMGSKRQKLGFGADTKYIVPSMSSPGSKWNVYGYTKSGKSVRLQSLQNNPKKVKKRLSIKPAFTHILNTKADKIFLNEASRVFTRIGKQGLGWK